jgi:hypothetical protein
MAQYKLTSMQKTFVKAIADAARGSQRQERPQGAQRGCPQWLAEKYLNFHPRYAFSSPMSSPATLEEIRREDGRYVAVYYNKVWDTNYLSKPWTERYTWVWRDGRMVETKQSGVRGGWRRLKGGV